MRFQVDASSRVPIYRQLATQIREAIARGTLSREERLPSVRQLSRELVVNPNTIARTYTELEREGILATRPGLGVFVAQPKDERTRTARKRRLLAALDQFLTEAVHLGFSADEVLEFVREGAERFQWPADEAGAARAGSNS
jgi:GntR family transcriptional regulator